MSTNVPLILGSIIPASIICIVLLAIGIPLIYALFALFLPIVIVITIDKNQKKRKNNVNIQLQTNFCTKCGEQIAQQNRFCTKCGLKME